MCESLLSFILSAPNFLQGAFFCTIYGQSDHTPDRGPGKTRRWRRQAHWPPGLCPGQCGTGTGCPGPRLGRGAGGRLTFRRLGRSLEGSQSAGSGSRPGRYGRSQPRSSCGCPAHTHPGLWGTEGDGRVYRGPVWRPLSEPRPPPPPPTLGAWVSEQLVLWMHSSHVPTSSTLDSSQGLEPLWGWHRGGTLRGRQSERTQVSSLKHLQEPKSLQRLSFETPLWVLPSGRHGLSLQSKPNSRHMKSSFPPGCLEQVGSLPFTESRLVIFF